MLLEQRKQPDKCDLLPLSVRATSGSHPASHHVVCFTAALRVVQSPHTVLRSVAIVLPLTSCHRKRRAPSLLSVEEVLFVEASDSH